MKTRITWVNLILILSSLILILPACQKDSLSNQFDDQSALSGTPRLKTSPNLQNLDKLLTLITEKVQSGEIPKGIGNSLTAKVNSAKSSIAKGQLKAAENVLKAFTNQVNDLITEGVLAEVLGGQLSQLAYEVFNPPTWKCGDNFTDARDGHLYKSVQIGNQCWMGENLAYLPEVNPTNMGSESTPRYYVYGYEGTDRNEARTLLNYNEYGVLYNWPAAMNGGSSSSSIPSGVQGACPQGWHLPSDAEWKLLEIFSGMSLEDAEIINSNFRNSGMVGGQLKEQGTSHWWYPNTGATNISEFTAIPAGYANFNGNFYTMGWATYFWTSTKEGSIDVISRYLYTDYDCIGRFYTYPGHGISIRCLKD